MRYARYIPIVIFMLLFMSLEQAEAAGVKFTRPKTLKKAQQSTGQAAAGPEKVVRYRVTVNGFKVERQTKVGTSGVAEEQAGGKGDEVFIETILYKVKKDGSSTRLTAIKSKTMGSIKKYPDRVKAGTASKHGGLKTGDRFPGNISASGEVRSGTAGKNAPPTVVYEGTFVEGEEAIVIIPTIWEWDKGNQTTARALWAQWDSGHLRSYMRSRPQRFFSASFYSTGSFARSLGMNPVQYAKKSDLRQTRPIGITEVTGKKGFWPRMVILNGELGEFLKVAGLNEKIVTLNYRDQKSTSVREPISGQYFDEYSDITSGDQHGKYVLYVKVERLR